MHATKGDRCAMKITDSEREVARKHLQAKQDFMSHLVAFTVVNAGFVAVWAMSGGGYFWPAWILGLWGAGLILHAWDTFIRRTITEEDVDEELRRKSAA